MTTDGHYLWQAPWAFRLLMMTVMSSIMADKNKQEELFLAGPGAELEFTLVRPGGLKSDPPNGIVNVIKVTPHPPHTLRVIPQTASLM